MKKIIAFTLCAAFCLSLAPSALAEGPDGPDPGPDGGNPGAFEGLDSESAGNYIIGEDLEIAPENSVSLAGGTVTVNSGVTLSIAAGGRLELRGTLLTNNGTIVVALDESGDPPEDGRLEIRDDIYHDPEEGDIIQHGQLINNGQLTIDGIAEFIEGAEVSNSGSMTVKGFLRLAGGAAFANSGTVDGQVQGRIMLDNPSGAETPLSITGLGFYDNAGDTHVTGDPNGQFVYDGDSSKWVRPADGGDPGPGPGPGPIGEPQNINVVVTGDGSVSFDGTTVISAEHGSINAGQGNEIVITPGGGKALTSIAVSFDGEPMDIMRDISINEDRNAFILTLGWYVFPDITLLVSFGEENTAGLVQSKSYAVLNGSEAQIREGLALEFGYSGYIIDTDRIHVSDIDTDEIGENGYGTFSFSVDSSGTVTGYIIEQFSDIIFRFSGMKGGNTVTEIRAAREQDGINGEFGAPAMDSGFLEVIGVYNVGVEGLISEDVRGAFDLESSSRNRQDILNPFYRAQFHIGNAYGADPFSDQSLNWFAFDLIQDDALCVQVSVSGDGGEQRTWEWELNRYAELTTGSYTSEIYFANDIVTLSLPASGAGGAKSLYAQTGDFGGYSVADDGSNTYTVTFRSNFYNEITLNLTINDEQRPLTIRRVGVRIADYAGERGSTAVFHGTQSGSRIDFSDETGDYRIYATYYLPDGGTVAPYGLYVTYTWANGSTTTAMLTNPADDPFHAEDFAPGDGFINGVFTYENRANACDYLLYAGPDAQSAPVSVSVTVLKNAPAADSFGGVSFGSGAGVTWMRVG